MLALDRHRRQSRLGNYRAPVSPRTTSNPPVTQRTGTTSFLAITTKPDPFDPDALTSPIAQSDVTGLTAALAGKQPLDSDLTTLAGVSITAAGTALLDDADAAAQRTTLGLGTLATQSGTFSGTSSGTNTGDQTNIAGNAATVTTNANLTGPITSTGNATAIASQTGTGTKFVVDTSPTLVTPLLGTPTSGVLTNMTGIDAWRGIAYATGTQSLTNAFADVTSLTFPVVAGGVYKFRAAVPASADATTTGIDIAVNGPASPTAIVYESLIWNSATAFSSVTQATAYDTNPATANSAGTVVRYYRVEGVLVNGTNAGTVAVRIKRENTGSGSTAAYGWVEWQRLA